jgi:anti-anti-sigma factor
MHMTFNKAIGKVEVSIIRLHGSLDAATYHKLVEQVVAMQKDGMKFVLLDLTEAEFISSAGIVALHSIARLLRGEKPTTEKEGWSALTAANETLIEQRAKQRYIKLYNPNPRVKHLLSVVGFDDYFDIFDDYQTAVESFA